MFAETRNHEAPKQTKSSVKLEAVDTLDSPPRTTVLGTVFSPVFNYFSPANRTGEMFTNTTGVYNSSGQENFSSDDFCSAVSVMLSVSVVLWLQQSFLLGLDLPGQAMEAEEIIKQLDMEQVEEMPMGTATSAPVQCVPIYPSAMSPYHSHTEDEEEDVVTHVDLPPLTGPQLNLLQELQLSVCLSIHLFYCLSDCSSRLLFVCLSNFS